MRSVKRTVTSLATWGIVILAVLSVDFVASWVFRGPIDSAFRKKDEGLRVTSSVFHHGLAPAFRVTGRHPFVTNSLGFRDEEPRDVPLKSAARRLLVIGDSFAEGSQVAYGATFVGTLAKRLSSEGVEVLNAAAQSYSPAIYYAKIKYLLEQVGLQIDEVMVFIDVSDVEDEARLYDLDAEGHVVDTGSTAAMATSTEPAEGARDIRSRFMTARAYFMLRERLRGGEGAGSSTSALGRRGALWTTDPVLFAEFGKRGLEKAREHMDLLRDLLASRGIPMMVVVYPWPDQVARRDLESRQVVFWRGWAEKNQIGFLDLFPTFINEEPAAEVLSRYWLPNDVHWNEAGHALVADTILKAHEARARAIGSSRK